MCISELQKKNLIFEKNISDLFTINYSNWKAGNNFLFSINKQVEIINTSIQELIIKDKKICSQLDGNFSLLNKMLGNLSEQVRVFRIFKINSESNFRNLWEVFNSLTYKLNNNYTPELRRQLIELKSNVDILNNLKQICSQEQDLSSVPQWAEHLCVELGTSQSLLFFLLINLSNINLESVFNLNTIPIERISGILKIIDIFESSLGEVELSKFRVLKEQLQKQLHRE